MAKGDFHSSKNTVWFLEWETKQHTKVGSSMHKKILVTGGAGYIGSHVVLLLSQQGYQIVVLDNLSTGFEKSIHGAELVVGDIGDQDLLDRLMGQHQFEAVMHFAGSIIVPESVKEPQKYYLNNTLRSHTLVNACLKHGIKNFIFSSTAAVYGLPESGECNEATLVNPISPYGRSKLMTEWMLEDASNAYADFRYVALRYFNVAGANVDGKVGQCSPFSTHLIKIACETALGKRNGMNVFGNDYETPDGTCVRDFIHTDDLADAHLKSLEYLLKGGHSEVFNCGYGHGYSVNEVIAMVKKISGVDFKVTMVGRRDGDPASVVAISDKIRKTLGWSPRYNDLELIVRTALDWERKLS